MYTFTYVSILVFALGAAAHITDGPDVPLLKASLIVENGNAVFLHHKGQRWKETCLWRVTVVISILNNRKREVLISHTYTEVTLFIDHICPGQSNHFAQMTFFFFITADYI